jgi:hypothetical protein
MATVYQHFALHIVGQGLAAMDCGGKSDPYYYVYVVPSSGARRRLCRSEIVMYNLDPEWAPQALYVSCQTYIHLLVASQFPIIVIDPFDSC